MIAHLGERIGQVETLARMFPEHEGRVNSVLEGFDARLRGLADELLGKHNALEAAFSGHTHDAPAPIRELEHVPEGAAEILDSPVQSIDSALDSVIPTPPAPQSTEVQAPPAMRNAPAYRSHLHRRR